MILVFLGPPGCGKGTHSQFLKETHGYLHLSTGEMLRNEVESKSEIGLKIASTMKAGLYVSDEIILDIIKKKLDQSEPRDVVFDGFPRTLLQAQSLEKVLEERSLNIDKVVCFAIQEDILRERIVGRFNCSKCGHVYHEKNNKPAVNGICDTCGSNNFIRREDDTEESLKKRLEVYHENTHPLINYYKDKNKLVEIDSSQSLSIVRQQLLTVIKGV